MSPARIRAYQARDFPEIHRIDQVCFPPDIAYSRAELLFYVRHPESITRVAELDRAVVGFIVGRIESSGTAHVVTLDVLPGARRREGNRPAASAALRSPPTARGNGDQGRTCARTRSPRRPRSRSARPGPRTPTGERIRAARDRARSGIPASGKT